MDFNHPAVQSVLLPLLIAFALSGAIRYIGGVHWGSRLAGAAISASMLIAIALLLGLPPWIPRTGMQKLSYVVAVGLLLGVTVELQTQNRNRIFSVGLVGLTLGYLWLAWPQLNNPSLSLVTQLGMLYLVAAVSFWRLAELREQNLTPVVMLVLAAIGLAGVAFVSGSLSIAQLSIALAAAAGGFALWNWPVYRFPFGTVGALGSGIAFLALLAVTLLLTDASPIALATLVFIFFANIISRRLPSGTGRLRDVLDPIYLALVAAIPTGLAIILAQILAETDNAYYY